MKLTTTFLALFATAPSAFAGACGGCPALCGRVINQTPFEMRYTTNPMRNTSPNMGECRFWNWYDSETDLTTENRLCGCTQQSIPPNGGERGGCGRKVDVDGFTFPTQRYWYQNDWRGPGIWTKFADPRTITCQYRDNNVIVC